MTAEPKLPYHHGQCDIRIVHLTDFDLWMRRSSIALENEIYTRHMPSKETRRSSRKKFKYSAPFKVLGNKRGSTISFSIIPAQMFTPHVSWKCVPAMMCGFVVDHQRVLCTLKILLRLFIKHTTRNVNQYNFAQASNDKKFPLDQNQRDISSCALGVLSACILLSFKMRQTVDLPIPCCADRFLVLTRGLCTTLFVIVSSANTFPT